MKKIQSSSYKALNKKKGTYSRSVKLRQLNVSAVPIRVKSTNQMKKKTSKGFAVTRRAAKNPTNMSSKAVSKSTKGMKGSGKSFKKGAAFGKNPVVQVAPAQRSGIMSPSRKVAINPVRQTKGNVSNKGLGAFRKSIRKTMGY